MALAIPKVKVPKIMKINKQGEVADVPTPPPVEHNWDGDNETEEVVEEVKAQPKEEPKQEALIIGKEIINGEMVWKLKANYNLGNVGDII